MICIVRIDRLWKFLWVLGHAWRLLPRQHPGVFISLERYCPRCGSPHTGLGRRWEQRSKPSGAELDGSHVPFGSTAAHDPAGLEILRAEVEVPG
ncbi:MAG TPA: hypothetical protein VNL13_04795 [Sulfolobales archaeon]|nr:hypothetical protein [Sulfolobales archaeon]